jgi:UDP-N-acetylmuramate dehydrogenase
MSSDVPLAPHTTYKLGGPARWLADASDMASLERVLEAWRAEQPPLLVLGRGSNVVVADGGFDGLVIRLGGEFASIDHRPDLIRAGAAVSLPMLARSAVASGRLGLEFYVGIPGSVGGAVHQNAGCHGSETKDVLMTATVVTTGGVVDERTPTDLGLSYRHSNLGPRQIVLNADFTFTPGTPADGEARMREVIRWRRINQPGGTLNAGSVFKNPPGDAAGRIIDEIGLKGLRVGGASVSVRHANFFVADEGATARDVRTLVETVRATVRDRSGIELEPELEFVGEFEVGS